MAFISRIKPGRGAARIDWRNPTTRGLAYWFLLDENGGVGGIGLHGRTAWAGVNGPTWKPTEIGPALSLDGTDDYLSFAVPNIPAGPGFTVDFWLRPAALTTDTRLLGNNTSATFNFRFNNTSFEFYPNAGGGAWAVLGTSSDIAAGKLVHLAATFTDNTASLQHDAQGWINGRAGTPITADIDTGLAVESTVYFGRRFADSFGNRYNGEIVQLRFWTRVLSSSEILGLYREPYGLLRTQDRKLFPHAGGTTYTQSVAGALTPSGAIAKQTGKLTAGAMTPTGAMIRRAAKLLTGAMTPAGAIIKQTARALTGGVTPSGALARQAAKLLSGGLTPSGALSRMPAKTLAGGVTPSGTLNKQTARSLSGGLTPAGALSTIRAALVSLAGTLGLSGALARQAGKSLAGGVTPAGDVVKLTARALSGGVTPSGAVSTIRAVLLSLTGTLTTSGALARQAAKTLAGGLTPAGGVIKQTARALAGAVAPSGALSTIRAVLLSLAGTLTTAGTLAKRTARSLSGGVTPSGTLSRRTARALAGTMAAAGALAAAVSGAGGRIKTLFRGMWRGMWRGH